MRVFMVPIIALGLVISDRSDEPSEHAMRMAFEVKLAAQVPSVMDYVAETSGPEAVDKLRQAGTDRFAVRTFKKQDCLRGETGYAFAVDLTVVTGNIQQMVRGRFQPGRDGQLTFTQES